MTNFPLQRLFDILRSSTMSRTEMGSETQTHVEYIGWQAQPRIADELRTLRDLLEPHIHDLQTHYQSWRKALTDWGAAADNEADASYAAHELKAFDRVFGALAGEVPTTLSGHPLGSPADNEFHRMTGAQVPKESPQSATPTPVVEIERVEDSRLKDNLEALAANGRELVCAVAHPRQPLWMLFHRPAVAPMAVEVTGTPIELSLVRQPADPDGVSTETRTMVKEPGAAVLRAHLVEAEELIRQLCDHEGAEGWSADLRTRLDAYEMLTNEGEEPSFAIVEYVHIPAGLPVTIVRRPIRDLPDWAQEIYGG